MNGTKEKDRDLQELLAFHQGFLQYGQELQQIAAYIRQSVDMTGSLLRDDVSTRACESARRAAEGLARVGADAEGQARQEIQATQNEIEEFQRLREL